MTIGIKTNLDGEEDFFLYLNAVQTYSKSKTGSVSKHPVAGRYITDHFVKDNPVFSLSGVVSFADLSDTTLIRDVSGNLALNAYELPTPTQVQQSVSGLLNFLPSAISQFIPDQSPTVTMDGSRNNYKDFVDQCLSRLMSGTKVDLQTGKEKSFIRTVNLYEYEGNILTKIHRDLVLTQYNTNEDVSTGDAIIVDLTFEQVSFVRLRTAAIPTDVVSGLKGRLAPKAKKGNVSSAPKNVDDINDDLSNAADVSERPVGSSLGNK